MQKIMFTFATAGLLMLTGCESTMPTKPEAEKAPAKVEAPQAQLSDEAKKALAQAEADVKAAQEQKALWTTAQDALKNAKEAAKKNDSAAVIKNAKEASEHAKLGIAQTKYPLTTISK
jgi:murein lipoprotein